MLRNQSVAATLHGGLWRVEDLDLDEDEKLAFQDFVQSISLTSEELSTLVARPELSVPEVKRLFERTRSS
jgi:hypothetical protein